MISYVYANLAEVNFLKACKRIVIIKFMLIMKKSLQGMPYALGGKMTGVSS